MESSCWIGIDVGGTKVLAGVFDQELRQVGGAKAKTPASAAGDDMAALIVALCRSALKDAGISRARGACVSVPGPLDLESGVVIDTPNIGFRDYPLGRRLASDFQCPVRLENDVNAGLYGEFRAGAARGLSHVVGIYPGSGVGGAMILGGALYRGRSGSAGEIGHMRVQDGGRLCGCGAYGCLETLASKNALARDIVALAATGKAPTVFEEAGTDYRKIRSGVILKSLEAGEAAVAELVGRAARYLGIGMANCVNIFNPEAIVLGGGLVEKLGDHLVPQAEASMRTHAMPGLVKGVRVLTATLGDASAITGCAWLAREAGS